MAGVPAIELAQVHLDSTDAPRKAIQRAFDHTLNPNHQLFAAVNVVVDFDPDLHSGTAQNRSLFAQGRKEHAPGASPIRRQIPRYS
jgi:hypothetical protein